MRVLGSDPTDAAGRETAARVSGIFFKATVQAVLLFGSETWNLTPSAVKYLEGFQVQAAYRIARVHKLSRNPIDGSWAYPPSEDVLEEVGIHPIVHHIEVQRQMVASFDVNRSIFNFCMDGERRRGTSPCQFWWEQPMDLDAASVIAIAVAANDESDGSDVE